MGLVLVEEEPFFWVPGTLDAQVGFFRLPAFAARERVADPAKKMLALLMAQQQLQTIHTAVHIGQARIGENAAISQSPGAELQGTLAPADHMPARQAGGGALRH